MAKTHEIDPNADTVIFLKDSLTDFAAQDSVDFPAEESSTEGSPVEPSEPGDSSHAIIQYHVSSSVLKLASPHFMRMLSETGWEEGKPNEDDGRYHIVVKEWDDKALLILLNALHHRNRQVPQSLSLNMLAKVAQLIDYYGCFEAVELWTKVWIENLETPIPADLGRNLMLWMYVAWVFELSELFTHTTVVAIKQNHRSQFSISDHPISRFVDRIDQARNEAIGTLIARLHDLLETYLDPNYKCPDEEYSFECGSILYGALTKGMDLLNLVSPYPQAPFPGIGFEDICTKVCRIESPKWTPATYSSYYSEHECGLAEKLEQIVDGARKSIEGLQLTDFARV